VTSVEGVYPKKRADKILPEWLTRALDGIGLLGLDEDRSVNRLGIPSNDLVMFSGPRREEKREAGTGEDSEMQGSPKITRRDFLKRVFIGAAAAIGGYSLYSYLESKRESMDEKSIDMTDIIKTLKEDEEFSLEKALGERWNPRIAKMWEEAKSKKGWSDESLRDMLLVSRKSIEDLSQASFELTGERFEFKSVKLLFDAESDSAITNTEKGADTLYINLLHDTPNQMLLHISAYTLPHELSHVIITSNFRRFIEKGLDHYPSIKNIRDADLEFQVRYLYPRDIILVMQEVLADKLGLRLAESMGRTREFVQGFENYANRELNRYSRILKSGRESSLTEITDIAGISVSARYFGNAELSDRLDEVAYGMIAKAVRLKGRESEEDSIKEEYRNFQAKLRNLANVEFIK